MPDNTPFVVGAYAVLWVGVIGYLLRVRALLRDGREALAAAERAAAAAGVPSGGSR